MKLHIHSWRTDYGHSRLGSWSHTHCRLCGITLRYTYTFPEIVNP